MTTTTITNLTPHVINVCGVDGTLLASIPPSGQVARCSVKSELSGEVNGLPVFTSRKGEVVGLPAPKAGTVFLVSLLVRESVTSRVDVFSPGELIRGTDGQPVGCKGLVSNGGGL